MARTIAEIKESILAAKAAETELDALDSTSATAIWRLWVYVVAVAMYVQETLFDSHKAEVTALIAAERVHSEKWYVALAKAYQYGYTLPVDSGTYATIDSAAQIIAGAATQPVTVGGFNVLRVKVAKAPSGYFESLTSPELTAFSAYMERVKDAGVHLSCTTQAGDDLQIELTVYYDPLVLDSAGARLDGTDSNPVLGAIGAFLQELPFNGELIVNRLRTAIEAVDGVVIADITTIQSQFGGGGYTPFTAKNIPDAGYYELDLGFLAGNTTYTAHDDI